MNHSNTFDLQVELVLICQTANRITRAGLHRITRSVRLLCIAYKKPSKPFLRRAGVSEHANWLPSRPRGPNGLRRPLLPNLPRLLPPLCSSLAPSVKMKTPVSVWQSLCRLAQYPCLPALLTESSATNLPLPYVLVGFLTLSNVAHINARTLPFLNGACYYRLSILEAACLIWQRHDGLDLRIKCLWPRTKHLDTSRNSRHHRRLRLQKSPEC